MENLPQFIAEDKRGAYVKMAAMLREKEDKGRTNIDVKDFWRNYNNRLQALANMSDEEREITKKKREVKRKNQCK